MSSNLPTSSRAARGLVGSLSGSIADLGALLLRAVEGLGEMLLFGGRTLRWLATSWPRRDTLVANMHTIGVESLPVVALIGAFIGMVLAVQSYTQFHALGLETQLGGVINKSMFRELGPVLAATMLAGRVGSAMAAELGTMRVTEQIDALASMGANPLQHLVAPRFLSCLLLIPSLTIVAVFMGVLGGYFFCTSILDIDGHHYWEHANSFVEPWDLFYGVAKSVFFGAVIGLVSCYRGFHCQPGAEGVGRAATTAFVYSFVAIIVLDLFLSMLLDDVYASYWPDAPTGMNA